MHRVALDDDAGRVDWRIRLAQRRDHALAASLGGAEVDEQHLVLVVLDEFGQRMSALGQIDWRELALEDRVLQVIAEVAHGPVDFAEAFVVADVVTDEKSVAHSLFSQDEQRPCGESPLVVWRGSQLMLSILIGG